MICLVFLGRCYPGVAVVVLAQVAFGGDGDGAPMGPEGEDIIERNREEGEVDGHCGCGCCCD
jgi:hypothetical protein